MVGSTHLSRKVSGLGSCLRFGIGVNRRGVLNIVHGTHGTVNRILDHPDIKAVSFVGSDAAGRYIYERGSASGKRVQVGVTAYLGYA